MTVAHVPGRRSALRSMGRAKFVAHSNFQFCLDAGKPMEALRIARESLGRTDVLTAAYAAVAHIKRTLDDLRLILADRRIDAQHRSDTEKRVLEMHNTLLALIKDEGLSLSEVAGFVGITRHLSLNVHATVLNASVTLAN